MEPTSYTLAAAAHLGLDPEKVTHLHSRTLSAAGDCCVTWRSRERLVPTVGKLVEFAGEGSFDPDDEQWSATVYLDRDQATALREALSHLRSQ